MRLLAALLLLSALSACGQKGPLYLPQDQAATETADQQSRDRDPR